jgi:uncharacterized protein
MSKEFAAARLDVKAFAEDAATLNGEDLVQQHVRLMAETQGRGADGAVTWSATGEVRNPLHVHPEIWLHLKAHTVLPLTCQRCLAPVEVQVDVQRSFRFVEDEEMAAVQDDDSEEDVLALSRSFDLIELVEDELLMELPIAPRHETCPEPLPVPPDSQDAQAGSGGSQKPFALLGKLKIGSSSGK